MLAGQASAHGTELRPQRIRGRLRRDVLGAEERERPVRDRRRADAGDDPRGAPTRGRRALSATSTRRSRSLVAAPEVIAGSRATGLTGAAFLHRTSRAGDPQLHTHVVVANLIQGSTASGRPSTAARLRARADGRATSTRRRCARSSRQRLGVRWRPVRNGLAEIDGMPEKVLRAFSRRRVEIEESMARHGSAGPKRARVAALDTRRAKDRNVRPEQLVPNGATARSATDFTSGGSSASAGWPRRSSSPTGTSCSSTSPARTGSRGTARRSAAAT